MYNTLLEGFPWRKMISFFRNPSTFRDTPAELRNASASKAPFFLDFTLLRWEPSFMKTLQAYYNKYKLPFKYIHLHNAAVRSRKRFRACSRVLSSRPWEGSEGPNRITRTASLISQPGSHVYPQRGSLSR